MVAVRRSCAAAARLSAAALSVAALGACGFAPVDVSGVPVLPVGIDIGERLLRDEFADFLGRKGVAVEEGASLRLRVDSRRDREIVGLTETGTANKHRLKYRVDYRITRGEETLQEDTIVLREVITHNESSHLAKREERENLYREMRRRVMSDIWFRLVRATGPL